MVSAGVETCDAVVVGAGPAGATAALGLARGGARVCLLERAKLPRIKLCAGWVTWGALRAAGIDPADYPGTIQPFAGAVVFGRASDRPLETRYRGPASFGIIRSELDAHLAWRAARAGARLRDGAGVRALRIADRRGGPGGRSPLFEITLDDGTAVRAPLAIGAGGQFCPVARAIGAAAAPEEELVICREGEVRLDEAALRRATPHYGLPELYAEPDLRGYAWYVTKGPYLNVGLGRLGRAGGADLKAAAARFLARLERLGRFRGIAPPPLKGHAYRVRDGAPRRLAEAGVLLAGDAAGLAADYSGEGIRPAIESGALAAEHALGALAAGDCSAPSLARYEAALARRLGPAGRGPLARAAAFLPARARLALADALLRSDRLRRRVVIEGLFGFSGEAA